MNATIKDIRFVTEKDTLYILSCPPIAQTALPGQFVEVKLSDTFFLRRPISIFDCDGKDTISLLIRDAGKGTRSMKALAVGEQLDILGPLGNGFSLDHPYLEILVVGGGIGAAPDYYLTKALLAKGKHVHFFFSPKREADLLSIMSLPECKTTIAENRSEIAAKLPSAIRTAQMVYACGPEGLLEMVSEECILNHIPGQISMERRMGCGIDLCKGCVVVVRREGMLCYKKVCTDGPVFDAKEVAFHAIP